MIVVCEECGKKYYLNASNVDAKVVRYQCKNCEHSFVIDFAAEAEEQEPEESISIPAESEEEFEPITAKSIEDDQTEGDTEASGVPQTSYAASKKVRFGIGAKLALLMIIIALAPMVVYWLVTFKQTNDQIVYEQERLTEQISTGLVSELGEWLDKNIRVLKALANMEGIISMDRPRQEPLLKAVQKAYPYQYLVFTVDPDGLNVARSDGKSLKDYSDRKYYADVMKGKPLVWQTLIGKTSKKPALILAVPIKDDTGKIVGVLANAMNIDAISKLVATWKAGKSGHAFLVDENGIVVAHPDRQFVVKRKNLIRHPAIAAFKKGHKGTLSYTYEGKKYFGQVQGTPQGWALAIQQEEQEIFQKRLETQKLAYMFLAITAVVVFFIALIAGRAMSKPLIKLTEATDRISIGELDVEIDSRRTDEIGLLADAIARMQDSIRLSIKRLRGR